MYGNDFQEQHSCQSSKWNSAPGIDGSLAPPVKNKQLKLKAVVGAGLPMAEWSIIFLLTKTRTQWCCSARGRESKAPVTKQFSRALVLTLIALCFPCPLSAQEDSDKINSSLGSELNEFSSCSLV